MDVDGNPIEVSGKIFIPKHGNIKNIILAHHYTIGANREAPSETYSYEGIFAAKGYIVIMTDYLGYGVSQYKVHPYLNAVNAAQNSVNLLNASLLYLLRRGVSILSPQLILFGYSQGGAVTLETQRLIEQHYAAHYSIKQVYAGDGPYYPDITYDECVANNNTNIPCAVPMLIQGMSESVHLQLPLEDFFRPPLQSNYEML